MSKRLVTGLAGALCVVPVFAATDNFNRQDLGDTWTTDAGDLYIQGKKLHGTAVALGTFNKAKHDTSATVDVAVFGKGVAYGAITIGDAASGKNVFMKIQTQNGEGTFDTAAFYTGNNGNGYFFGVDLPPTNKIRMTGSMSGTVATMTFTDTEGNVLASYSYDYGWAPKKAGIGLGTDGNVALDRLSTMMAADGDAVPASNPLPEAGLVDKTH
jgi:hypothetical protein